MFFTNDYNFTPRSEFSSMFFIECTICSELLAVEICCNCINILHSEGIQSDSNFTQEEQENAYKHNARLMCSDCSESVKTAFVMIVLNY